MTAMAVLGGFCLDLLLGDPRGLPHPVRLMGAAIQALEKGLRRLFPATPLGERLAGGVLALALPLGSFGAAWGLLRICGLFSPWLAFGAEVILCWQAL